MSNRILLQNESVGPKGMEEQEGCIMTWLYMTSLEYSRVSEISENLPTFFICTPALQFFCSRRVIEEVDICNEVSRIKIRLFWLVTENYLLLLYFTFSCNLPGSRTLSTKIFSTMSSTVYKLLNFIFCTLTYQNNSPGMALFYKD